MGPPAPHLPLARQSRLSCSSTATHSGSTNSDSRKALHRKENQFIYRNGSKLHAYDRDKAPYPCSFDRDVLELQCLDNSIMTTPKGTLHFTQFDGNYPKRCLDIGTGLGLWVISMAKNWPEATFVGLDMVNIQIPLRMLDTEIADRIEWAHTNILRNKLPFEDDEFDFVRIQSLAVGIPENKWHDLYEDIRRVMKPGGVIEHVEEDPIFPTLPKWYTDALRAHSRGLLSVAPGAGEQRLSYQTTADTSHLTHEHELLESLFYDVWSNRFINSAPTSVTPSYFTAFFERVVSPPLSMWLMPPFAPFAPIAGYEDRARPSMRPSQSPHPSEFGPSPLLPSRTPADDSLDTSPSSTLRSTLEPEHKLKDEFTQSPSHTSLSLEQEVAQAIAHTRHTPKNASTVSLTSQAASHSSGSGPRSASSRTGKRPSVMLLAHSGDSTWLGGEGVADIIPMDRFEDLDEQTSYMHLYRAVTFVLSTREAMWEELMVRVSERDERLRRFGWRDEDYTEQMSRAKFDFAVDLYRSDMRGRIALWHCAVQGGWEMPARDPSSKAEAMEELSLRREILEAQRVSDTGEPEPPCRRFRILIGHKDSVT